MGQKFFNQTKLNAKSVTVVGGGLAGIAAAWKLSCAGYRVILIEKRPFLGGRAYSYTDPKTESEVDNGQHVFMKCFTEYIELLSQFGSIHETQIQESMKVEVRDSNGRLGVIGSSILPSFLNMLPSLITYKHLSFKDKVRAIPALLKIKFEKDSFAEHLQKISFKDWLIENKQSERSISNFWELVILPTLNDHANNVSASMAFMVFQTALLAKRHSADIGFAKHSLSALMGSPMKNQLIDKGVSLVLGKQVASIEHSRNSVIGIKLNDGSIISSDFYISAIPSFALMSVLPEPLKKTALGAASNFQFSPIINAHIWYDNHVADFEWTAFIDSPLQYVFNRSKIAELETDETHLTVSISGAGEFWSMSKQQIKEMVIDELQRLLPLAYSAKVKRSIIIKEQRATFRNLPGVSSQNRLKPRTSLDNFFLAGDWTDTGWPSTMEGAVISGNSAATEVMLAQARKEVE